MHHTHRLGCCRVHAAAPSHLSAHHLVVCLASIQPRPAVSCLSSTILACIPTTSACNPPPLPAVPCLQRAAAVEEYGAREEQEVEADDGEGWVTASQAAPGAAPAGATTTNEDGFEEIPSVDEAAGSSGGAGAGDAAAAGGGAGGEAAGEEEEEEDVPDIADLELEEEEDEVGC